jgi:hypothetical protein
MGFLWALFFGVVLVVACLLAAVFIVGTYNVVVDAWTDWARRRGGEPTEGPMSEDPFLFAVSATLFAAFIYGLIIAAFIVVVIR